MSSWTVVSAKTANRLRILGVPTKKTLEDGSGAGVEAGRDKYFVPAWCAMLSKKLPATHDGLLLRWTLSYVAEGRRVDKVFDGDEKLMAVLTLLRMEKSHEALMGLVAQVRDRELPEEMPEPMRMAVEVSEDEAEQIFKARKVIEKHRPPSAAIDRTPKVNELSGKRLDRPVRTSDLFGNDDE